MNIPLKKPIIFFDLETTGLDIGKDKIVQIAAIKFYPDGNNETKNIILNPEIPIPKEASDVHGLTDEIVKDKPAFKQYAKSMLEWFSGCDLAGYNTNRFDIPFLVSQFESEGLELDLSEVSFLDVFALENKLFPRDLSTVYKKYLNEELSDAHNALADIQATVEIFNSQLSWMDDKEVHTDIEANSVEQIDKAIQGDKKRADVFSKFVFQDGVLVWNFGKNKGQDVKKDTSYVDWFIQSDFPEQSKQFLRKYLMEEHLYN
ncbi:MAG: 3'-5' exonuclease [Desulfobulbia bacterium]